ncbi:MAG: FAD/NAD(P)-binding protein [Gammaproteobacteria bacterium]|jgi:NAD(P)H-flavin reductase|nr:FAD/NAD(P)-binding protein [Gammaproteobacteria bacterium]
MTRPDLPRSARVDQRVVESPTIFTLRLAFDDAASDAPCAFVPGQFNMVWLPGVGEVALSIVSDPADEHFFDHTVRRVGRVTTGLDRLRPGDRVGVRGPFGHGWPLARAEGNDLLLLTGGLGCACVVSVIRYVLRRRQRFGRLVILQGVRHAEDLIWRPQYEAWGRAPGTQVLLAADAATRDWHGAHGVVVDLLDRVRLDPRRTIAMLCGPELMLIAAIAVLRGRGLPDDALWLSLERNMQCGHGRCGHCQIGPLRVCTDGPVFSYAAVADHLGVHGV